MNLNKKKVFNLMLMIGFMAFIFFMSAKTASDSTKQSDFVINLLNSFGIDLSGNFGDFASVIVRKGGHLTEYMILSFLIYNVVSDYIFIEKRIFIYTIIGVMLYATTDEIHQIFVPGRAGRVTDVMIDTLGGCIGIIFIKARIVILNKRKSKQC